MNLNFKIKSDRSFLNRLQPRLSLSVAETIFFDYDLNYKRSYVIDSLYYTDPNKAPLLIDSVASGTLKYSYATRLVMLEAGTNVELFTSRYFNLYSAFMVGEGFLLSSEFKTQKLESYSIDGYPNQDAAKTETLVNNTTIEQTPGRFVTRLSFAVGAQHRFSNRHKRSIGLFAEIRPGVEFYSVRKGLSPVKQTILVVFGSRYALAPHK